MATINEVIDKVMTTITAATKWSCTTNWDAPNLPCVLVYPTDMPEVYQAMQRGVVTYPIVANVLVSSTDTQGQQRALYDAISPFGATSILQAIYSNPTLGTDPDEATAGSSAGMMASIVSVSEIGPVTVTDGNRVLQTRMIQAKVRIAVMTRGDR